MPTNQKPSSLDRFPLAVRQWAAEGAGYVGCVHMGNTAETTDVWDDWYNPVAMLAANHRQFAYMRGGETGHLARGDRPFLQPGEPHHPRAGGA